MTRHGRGLALAITLVSIPLISGCGAAAAGAAGAAAGMAYSERGATSHVNASMTEIANATESVFRAMNIRLDEREEEVDDDEIELKGTDGNNKVVVDIDGNRNVAQSHIEVTVSRDIDYDKARAQQILSAILAALES